MSHSSYLQALSQRSNSCLRGCQSLRLQVPRVSASRQPPGSTHSNRAGRLLTWRPSPAPCKAQSRGNAPSTEQASQKLQQPRQSATAALHAGSGSASRQPASGADLWSAAWQTDLTGDEIDMRDLGDWDQLQEAVQQLPGRYKQFMQLYDRCAYHCVSHIHLQSHGYSSLSPARLCPQHHFVCCSHRWPRVSTVCCTDYRALPLLDLVSQGSLL